MSDGPCGATIVANSGSYSGYSHAHGSGWQHWASPTSYGPGVKEAERIFAVCLICGQTGPGNGAHAIQKKFGGHTFEAKG